MDATQGTSVELLDELDLWLHCCDICIEIATSPVATTCGHFFCHSCLNEAFQGEQERPCPVCRADLLQETAQSFPINRIVAPAEPTPEVANSETHIRNAGNRGPAARTPVTARSSLISTARMDVVRDYLEQENGYIHNIQLTLSRHVSDLRGERIRELEQVVENLVQMNLAVLLENGRPRPRQAQNESPACGAGNPHRPRGQRLRQTSRKKNYVHANCCRE